LNQQQRIAQIASTGVSGQRRIKNLQKKRLRVGVAFSVTLVCLAVYVDSAYSKTFISLPLILVSGAGCGVPLSLLLPKSMRLNIGMILLFAAASMALSFAVNNNLGNGVHQTVTLPILKKSTYTGRNASPYVSISYNAFNKKLPVRAPADVAAAKYVILNIKPGYLGYSFIDSYQLVLK
jgi:hypothetical protein